MKNDWKGIKDLWALGQMVSPTYYLVWNLLYDVCLCLTELRSIEDICRQSPRSGLVVCSLHR